MHSHASLMLILDKILQLLTYYLPFFHCKVINSQKQPDFLAHPVEMFHCSAAKLWKLYWLTVTVRVKHKLCPLAHKAAVGHKPK